MLDSSSRKDSFTAILERSSIVENKNSPTRPFDETARLAELHSLDILDSPSDKYFDRHTRLVAEILKVPIVAVSLVDKDRQWFKSSVGVEVCETPLDKSFCVHALERDTLEIADTLEDEFFRDQPLVVGSPFIRFYMGVVLRGPTGQPLGTLCIMDTQSRYLSRMQHTWLVTFGKLIEELINHDHTMSDGSQQAKQVSQRKSITGLPDATLFGKILKSLISISEQERSYMAILHLRLNRLNEIARIHGRPARDAVLCSLSDRLNAHDTKVLAAGHLSQAEFGAVISIPSLYNLFSLITPIFNKLSRRIELDTTTIQPAIDVGISLCPVDGTTIEDLLERAKSALDGPESYAGVHVFNNEAEKSALRRHTIEQNLESALRSNQLTKHYQPLVAIDGSHIMGFEALARWNDSELGNVSPADFVPIAEQNARLCKLLTEWSLNKVCGELPSWPFLPGDPPLRIAVNIPPAQFYEQGFVDRVLNTLEERQFPAERLALELTEECMLANVDKALESMRELRSHNIAIALDDFGTGYSALSYLKSLPIDILKIDKSFVDNLTHDSRSANLVNCIIRIAHGYGLQVIAEGVEHEAQRVLLHEFECDAIQGYLLSRALPPDDALALLKTWPQAV